MKIKWDSDKRLATSSTLTVAKVLCILQLMSIMQTRTSACTWQELFSVMKRFRTCQSYEIKRKS